MVQQYGNNQIKHINGKTKDAPVLPFHWRPLNAANRIRNNGDLERQIKARLFPVGRLFSVQSSVAFKVEHFSVATLRNLFVYSELFFPCSDVCCTESASSSLLLKARY